MRGQVIPLMVFFSPSRITPADAGTSVPFGGVQILPEDHPRGCGDKMKPPDVSVSSGGSPPRMRGQVLAAVLSGKRAGITPADAGTSLNNPFM